MSKCTCPPFHDSGELSGELGALMDWAESLIPTQPVRAESTGYDSKSKRACSLLSLTLGERVEFAPFFLFCFEPIIIAHHFPSVRADSCNVPSA